MSEPLFRDQRQVFFNGDVLGSGDDCGKIIVADIDAVWRHDLEHQILLRRCGDDDFCDLLGSLP